MLSLLISLLITVLILGLIYWVLTIIPIPANFKWVAQLIFAIICIIVLVELLTGGLHIHPLT